VSVESDKQKLTYADTEKRVKNDQKTGVQKGSKMAKNGGPKKGQKGAKNRLFEDLKKLTKHKTKRRSNSSIKINSHATIIRKGTTIDYKK
jgi:hypothetical protein